MIKYGIKWGRGSIADISPVMRQWHEKRKQQTTVLLSMPEVIRKAGEHFVTQLWASADQEALKQMEIIKAESDERLATYEQERDEALEEVKRLEGEHQQMQESHAKLDASLKEQAERITMLESEKLQLALEQGKAAAQLEAQSAQHKELKVSLAEEKKQNSALQKEFLALAKMMQGAGKKKG